jgi:hypothetical protein
MQRAVLATMTWTSLLALIGCAPKPATVADLTFPVVVIFGTTAAALYRDAADLGEMSIGHLNAQNGSPPLIDSSFVVYRLDKLASTHSSMWLMTHPTGTTSVTFELARAETSGIDAARRLLRARLDEQTWRDDLDDARRAIATGNDLAAMFAAVKGGGK